MIIPQELEYTPGEPQEERRRKRIERVKLYGLPESAPRVQVVTERIEVPVDRIVEKIVYRDPPVESTLRKAEAGLEAAQAKLEARVKPDAVPVELQEHVQEGETVSEAKSRFLKLYSDLGNKVQMGRSEEHTSELQSRLHLVCRLLLEKKKHLSI